VDTAWILTDLMVVAMPQLLSALVTAISCFTGEIVEMSSIADVCTMLPTINASTQVLKELIATAAMTNSTGLSTRTVRFSINILKLAWM